MPSLPHLINIYFIFIMQNRNVQFKDEMWHKLKRTGRLKELELPYSANGEVIGKLMICDICKKKNAVIHIEKHASNNHTQLNICADCAGIESFSPDKIKGEDLNRIINELAAYQKSVDQASCEDCGTTSEEFQKTAKVGCAKCYTNLSKAVNLRAWQVAKSMKHIGRTPFNLFVKPADFAENVEDLQIIEEKLEKSISSENYEEAAILRDRIMELKKALA